MEGKSFSARTLDAHALKSFAHPTRLRLYELLDEHGPSTATRLAERLRENTGVTSYHLRELAKHGMIEQVPGLGYNFEVQVPVTVVVREVAEQQAHFRFAEETSDGWRPVTNRNRIN